MIFVDFGYGRPAQGPAVSLSTWACLLLAATLIVAGSGCAARAPAALTSAHDVRHVVEPGQTLWSIARAYDVTVETLARANGIEDPTELPAGASILIPGATRRVDVPVVSLPTAALTWPVSGGRVLSYFGAPRRTHRHQGLDIAGRRGQAVRAAGAGVVTYSGSGMRGYGKTVIVDHGDGLSSLYAHNSRLLVRSGQSVEPGQAIAELGRSGNATTDHCHFELRRGEVAIDPLRYLTLKPEASP